MIGFDHMPRMEVDPVWWIWALNPAFSKADDITVLSSWNLFSQSGVHGTNRTVV